jgi:hypothetical protein
VFFTAEDGSRYLVSDIQHVEPMQEERGAAVVWLKGDRSAMVTKPALEHLMRLPAALVPAQSNTYVLGLAAGDATELDVVRRTAVVA